MTEKPYDPDDRYIAMGDVVSAARNLCIIGIDRPGWNTALTVLSSAVIRYDDALRVHAERRASELAGENPDSSAGEGSSVGSAPPEEDASLSSSAPASTNPRVTHVFTVEIPDGGGYGVGYGDPSTWDWDDLRSLDNCAVTRYIRRTSEQACGLCGKDPASGFASVDGIRYCHGDDDPTPTCYERVHWAAEDASP